MKQAATSFPSNPMPSLHIFANMILPIFHDICH